MKYRLTLTSEQARETVKAVELLMRLKLNQWDVLPDEVLDWKSQEDMDDFCRRRDSARPLLQAAFCMLFDGKAPETYKDDEWYRLYNLYQVIRHAVWEAETPRAGWHVASNPPMQFTDEPLPRIEIVQED